MFLLITVSILLITALVLVALRFTAGEYRYSWLIAAIGALFAWISMFAWQLAMPITIQLTLWQPATLFSPLPWFVADGIAWAFALSLVSLCLAVILTAVVRDNFPYSLSWIGLLILTALGVLAVSADNPITLVLIWAAIDIAELISQLRLVEQPQQSEHVVIAFASHVAGILILLWADMVSFSNGVALDFRDTYPQANIYLILAAGLRLGVLPLHLPYPTEASIRRGFGTGLRMISVGSSLILITRISISGLASPGIPYVIIFVAFAGLYGAWMWLRAPDELTGRPYFIIGMGSLALFSALRANPSGAAAWSLALILAGSALFLTSVQMRWLERILYFGIWASLALPFSLTASGWISNGTTFWYAVPFLIVVHGMLLAGLIRHIQRSAARSAFADQPFWARNVYPIGILILFATTIILTFTGWNGARQVGNWLVGLASLLLATGLIWLTPRVRILNPVRAHWVRPTNPAWLDWIYRTAWNGYRQFSQVGETLSRVLEGESGIMWTLLFLAFFISIFLQGTP